VAVNTHRNRIARLQVLHPSPELRREVPRRKERQTSGRFQRKSLGKPLFAEALGRWRRNPPDCSDRLYCNPIGLAVSQSMNARALAAFDSPRPELPLKHAPWPYTSRSRTRHSCSVSRPRQASARTSSVSGVSPSGLGMTSGPVGAPGSTGSSADSRIADPPSVYSRMRHKSSDVRRHRRGTGGSESASSGFGQVTRTREQGAPPIAVPWQALRGRRRRPPA
jgi:hypothetical protein